MDLCCVDELGEEFLDGICCEAGTSYEEVVVDGICPRGNSWAERVSMQEIQEFGLGFFSHTQSLTCAHKMDGKQAGE